METPGRTKRHGCSRFRYVVFNRGPGGLGDRGFHLSTRFAVLSATASWLKRRLGSGDLGTQGWPKSRSSPELGFKLFRFEPKARDLSHCWSLGKRKVWALLFGHSASELGVVHGACGLESTQTLFHLGRVPNLTFDS